jgi:NAD(P)H-hydrate epimerase
VPEPLAAVVDGGSIESMTLALPAGPSGQIAAAAVERALAATAGKEVLALGPGLGLEAETEEAIRRLVRSCEIPLVIDADGLNAFAGRAGELAERRAAAILTPHPGELGRLLGISASEVQADRLAAARRAAATTRAVVVLKGHLTLIATPDGPLHVNPTGNPGMATGGTGDVLTGLLAGLLAQGMTPADAARLGAYIHGVAGDRVAARLGERGLAANDLAEELPRALAALAE